MREPLGGRLGPGEQRRLRVDLGEQGRRRERGRLDDAGEGRLAAGRDRGGGGRRAVGADPASAGRCRSSPRRRRAPSARGSARRRTGRRPGPSLLAVGRCRRCGCRRSSRPRRSGARARASRRGRRAGPWRCRRCRSATPGGRVIVPAPRRRRSCASARVGAADAARLWRWSERPRRERSGLFRQRVPVAGALDLVEQGRVDQAVAEQRRPSGDGRQPRSAACWPAPSARGSRLRADQLAVGEEAGEAPVGVEQLCSARERRLLGAHLSGRGHRRGRWRCRRSTRRCGGPRRSRLARDHCFGFGCHFRFGFDFRFEASAIVSSRAASAASSRARRRSSALPELSWTAPATFGGAAPEDGIVAGRHLDEDDPPEQRE